jgi:ribosomal protein S18 acetylase RimI-like enzyme
MDLDIHVCTEADMERFRALSLPGRAMARHEEKFAHRHVDTFIVAWNGDEPAGFVSVLSHSKYPNVREALGDFPELNALEAMPQGQGIGRAIIRFAEAHVRSNGARRVGLAVEPENVGALRLYERLGYSDWGRGFVVDHWHELDDRGNPTVTHADDCLYLAKLLDN